MHAIQRGVNRAGVFIDDDDRAPGLALLRNEAKRADIAERHLEHW